MADDDLLKGTEAVARAFHKHLRDKVVIFEFTEDPETLDLVAKMKLGNYVISFEGERVEGCGLIQYRVKDVSDAS